MNVTCNQCSAKYAISDERVKGRRVRIKCKRCGSAFVVDGTEQDARAPLERSLTPGGTSVVHAPTENTGPATGSSPDQGAPPDLWLVAVTDDSTQEMTTAQLIEAYATNTIDQYTYVWREGMPDWLTPFDVPELTESLTARGFQRAADDLAARSEGGDAVVWREPGRPSSPENPPLPDYSDVSDQEITRALTRDDMESAQGLAPLTTGGNFFDRGKAKISERPSGVDLFGAGHRAAGSGDSQAGPAPVDDAAAHDAPAQETPAKNAPAEPAQPAQADESLTGARHESSVLFSLTALVASEEAKNATFARAVRAEDRVSEDVFLADNAPPEPSDPIAALSATVDPLLSPSRSNRPPSMMPASVLSADASSLAPPRRGAGPGLWIALGCISTLAVGAFAAIALDFLHLGPVAWFPSAAERSVIIAATPTPSAASAAAPASSAAPSAIPSAEAVPSAAPVASTAPVASAASAPLQPSAAPQPVAAAPQPAAANPHATQPPASTPPASPTPAPAAPAQPAAAPAAPAQPAAPVAAAPTPAEPAAAPAAAEPAAAGPFNTEAAKATLSSVTANATANCKVPGTPAGTSKVAVTFVPSGRVTQALVSGDFAGTPAGSCIARVFRGAQVPAFSGASVTVSKSITLH